MVSGRARGSLGLLAAAVLLAGCGGDSGSKQDNGVTRPAYIAKVDALCKRVTARSRPTNRKLQALVKASGTYRSRLMRSPPLLRKTYRLQSGKLASFGALTPPTADVAQITELTKAAEGALAQLHDAIAIAERGDLKSFIDVVFDSTGARARAERLGTTYGFRADCFTVPIKLE